MGEAYQANLETILQFLLTLPDASDRFQAICTVAITAGIPRQDVGIFRTHPMEQAQELHGLAETFHAMSALMAAIARYQTLTAGCVDASMG